MKNKRKLNEDNAYHPEKFDKGMPLLPKKPSDEFLGSENVTLITMDNLRKLDRWEKKGTK